MRVTQRKSVKQIWFDRKEVYVPWYDWATIVDFILLKRLTSASICLCLSVQPGGDLIGNCDFLILKVMLTLTHTCEQVAKLYEWDEAIQDEATVWVWQRHLLMAMTRCDTTCDWRCHTGCATWCATRCAGHVIRDVIRDVVGDVIGYVIGDRTSSWEPLQ